MRNNSTDPHLVNLENEDHLLFCVLKKFSTKSVILIRPNKQSKYPITFLKKKLLGHQRYHLKAKQKCRQPCHFDQIYPTN